MSETHAYAVEVNGWSALFYAPTPKAARMKAVLAYWEAYGKNGWPETHVQPRPWMDKKGAQ